MKQGRPQGSAGGRAACHSDSGPGAGPPRGARRVSRRGPDRGPGGDGARRAGCALPLAGLRLGPRHRGPLQPGRWLLARGAVQPGVRPRVSGSAFCGRHLARPCGPLGAPQSHHAQAWLPFSETTVMVRPAAGLMCEWTGLDPSACFGVSLFRHEIVGYEGHCLVREGVLHLQ